MSAPMESIEENRSSDLFKQSFKYFKRRKPPPDLTDVIDFGTLKSAKRINCLQVQPKDKTTAYTKVGLKPPQDWKAFTLPDVPGFMFLQDPFLPGSQRYWIKRCLQDYPNKPNVCNLDAHMTLTEEDSVWDMRQSDQRKSDEGKSLIEQLRWVTFGYHHNWDTKVYQSDHHTPFPKDIAGMTELIAGALGYEAYQAEAAIVNFYHLDSTLGGHTDHSEFDLESPIISYSFGQSAIFLVGGQTKETTPTAMFLHSGDIIIMGGPSRLAYHAIPKILPGKDGKLPLCLQLNPELTACAGESQRTCDSPQLSCDSAHDSAHGADQTKGTGCSASNIQERKVVQTGTESGDSNDKPKHDFVSATNLNSDLDQRTENSCESNKRSNESEVLSAKVVCTGQSASIASIESTTSISTDLQKQESVQAPDELDISSEVRKLCCTEHWRPFADYMRTSRINVSVRKVLKPGEGFPEVTQE